jgi:hypothetical protein
MSPTGACVAGNNSERQKVAQSIAAILNTASPTAYSFPYDDAIKLFDCQAKSWSVTNYTVNFCPNDTDGDRVQESVDGDSDNDGIQDAAEGRGSVGAAASSRASDLIGTDQDADGDGIPNWYDLDSDNDGIPDHEECGGTDDANKDGRADSKVDSDGDGIIDEYDPDQGGAPLVCPDTDGDGMPDYKDTNSDNQGASDFVEEGGVDSDGDRLLDIFDSARGSAPLTIRDSDGDDIPDHLDAVNNKVGGGCALSPVRNIEAPYELLPFLFLPALILLRRFVRISNRNR